MNRRNKRTSFNQYTYFLDTMEANPRLAANKVSRLYDAKKWKEMSVELNKCPLGPKLSAEDWRKRLNDWKNTTRSKYRRSIAAGARDSMTALENRAMNIFFAVPISIEPVEYEEYEETQEEQEELIDDEPHAHYQELEPAEEPAATVLIRGSESSAHSIRLQNPASVIYEVETILPTNISDKEKSVLSFAKEIQDQLKRISDIHEAALHFKIARFKYKNPGFEYNLDNI
ncbi:hypothetical protein KR054_007668 [Drosophila jambulina]|nr:hypothetical protein KR054_007668 [Drosophila jambulina]